MCWISFRKIETLKNMLETQSSRWMDWVGLMYQWTRWVTIHKIFTEKDYKHWLEWKTWEKEPMSYYFTDDRSYSYPKLEEFYQDVIELTTRGFDQNKFVFAHHRKWTVGSNGIPNTHPFETDKFILAQNGTDRRIHEWGMVEWIDPDCSDTFVLLQYLDMHCSTLQECLERINILISRNITIGTIMVYSKAEWKLMFFADWERSLYIEKNADWTINYIQSRKDDWTVDYKTEGYIVVDFTWQVLVEDLKNVNEAKVVVHKAAANPNAYYWTQQGAKSTQAQLPARTTYGSIYWDNDWYDECNWGWIDWGFQDINPDAEDVNEIEAENDWINHMPISDVMELLADCDEKKYFSLKGKTSSWTSTAKENEEYVNIIIYVGMLIRRGIMLTEKLIKEIENTKKWFLHLAKPEIHTAERNKKIYQLRMQMMELNSYKEIYKL